MGHKWEYVMLALKMPVLVLGSWAIVSFYDLRSSIQAMIEAIGE